MLAAAALPRLPWPAALGAVALAAFGVGLLSLVVSPCPRGDADGFWRAGLGESTGYTSWNTAGELERPHGPWLIQFSSCTGRELLRVDEGPLRAGLPALRKIVTGPVEDLRGHWDVPLARAALERAEAQGPGFDLPALLAGLQAARMEGYRASFERMGRDPAEIPRLLAAQRGYWDEQYAIADRAPALDALLAAALVAIVAWPWARGTERAFVHVGAAGLLLLGAFTLHDGWAGWTLPNGVDGGAPVLVRLVRGAGPWAVLCPSLALAVLPPWLWALRRPRGETAGGELLLAGLSTAPLALGLLAACWRLAPTSLGGLEERLLVPPWVALGAAGSAALLVVVMLLRARFARSADPQATSDEPAADARGVA